MVFFVEEPWLKFLNAYESASQHLYLSINCLSSTFVFKKLIVKSSVCVVVVHFDKTLMTIRHGETGNHARSKIVWVVCRVDVYSRKCFLRFLSSRSRLDLILFLKEWIFPESVFRTYYHR